MRVLYTHMVFLACKYQDSLLQAARALQPKLAYVIAGQLLARPALEVHSRLLVGVLHVVVADLVRGFRQQDLGAQEHPPVLQRLVDMEQQPTCENVEMNAV